MIKLNKGNIRKWVSKLRSEKYLQNVGGLRDKRYDGKIGYCCLGIACLAYREATNRHDGGSFKKHGVLPDRVASWLGFGLNNPIIAKNISAAAANDSEGWSFSEIADAIEKRYLKG